MSSTVRTVASQEDVFIIIASSGKGSGLRRVTATREFAVQISEKSADFLQNYLQSHQHLASRVLHGLQRASTLAKTAAQAQSLASTLYQRIKSRQWVPPSPSITNLLIPCLSDEQVLLHMCDIDKMDLSLVRRCSKLVCPLRDTRVGSFRRYFVNTFIDYLSDQFKKFRSAYRSNMEALNAATGPDEATRANQQLQQCVDQWSRSTRALLEGLQSNFCKPLRRKVIDKWATENVDALVMLNPALLSLPVPSGRDTMVTGVPLHALVDAALTLSEQFTATQLLSLSDNIGVSKLYKQFVERVSAATLAVERLCPKRERLGSICSDLLTGSSYMNAAFLALLQEPERAPRVLALFRRYVTAVISTGGTSSSVERDHQRISSSISTVMGLLRGPFFATLVGAGSEAVIYARAEQECESAELAPFRALGDDYISEKALEIIKSCETNTTTLLKTALSLEEPLPSEVYKYLFSQLQSPPQGSFFQGATRRAILHCPPSVVIQQRNVPVPLPLCGRLLPHSDQEARTFRQVQYVIDAQSDFMKLQGGDRQTRLAAAQSVMTSAENYFSAAWAAGDYREIPEYMKPVLRAAASMWTLGCNVMAAESVDHLKLGFLANLPVILEMNEMLAHQVIQAALDASLGESISEDFQLVQASDSESGAKPVPYHKSGYSINDLSIRVQKSVGAVLDGIVSVYRTGSDAESRARQSLMELVFQQGAHFYSLMSAADLIPSDEGNQFASLSVKCKVPQQSDSQTRLWKSVFMTGLLAMVRPAASRVLTGGFLGRWNEDPAILWAVADIRSRLQRLGDRWRASELQWTATMLRRARESVTNAASGSSVLGAATDATLAGMRSQHSADMLRHMFFLQRRAYSTSFIGSCLSSPLNLEVTLTKLALQELKKRCVALFPLVAGFTRDEFQSKYSKILQLAMKLYHAGKLDAPLTDYLPHDEHVSRELVRCMDVFADVIQEVCAMSNLQLEPANVTVLGGYQPGNLCRMYIRKTNVDLVVERPWKRLAEEFLSKQRSNAIQCAGNQVDSLTVMREHGRETGRAARAAVSPADSDLATQTEPRAGGAVWAPLRIGMEPDDLLAALRTHARTYPLGLWQLLACSAEHTRGLSPGEINHALATGEGRASLLQVLRAQRALMPVLLLALRLRACLAAQAETAEDDRTIFLRGTEIQYLNGIFDLPCRETLRHAFFQELLRLPIEQRCSLTVDLFAAACSRRVTEIGTDNSLSHSLLGLLQSDFLGPQLQRASPEERGRLIENWWACLKQHGNDPIMLQGNMGALPTDMALVVLPVGLRELCSGDAKPAIAKTIAQSLVLRECVIREPAARELLNAQLGSPGEKITGPAAAFADLHQDVRYRVLDCLVQLVASRALAVEDPCMRRLLELSLVASTGDPLGLRGEPMPATRWDDAIVMLLVDAAAGTGRSGSAGLTALRSDRELAQRLSSELLPYCERIVRRQDDIAAYRAAHPDAQQGFAPCGTSFMSVLCFVLNQPDARFNQLRAAALAQVPSICDPATRVSSDMSTRRFSPESLGPMLVSALRADPAAVEVVRGLRNDVMARLRAKQELLHLDNPVAFVQMQMRGQHCAPELPLDPLRQLLHSAIAQLAEFSGPQGVDFTPYETLGRELADPADLLDTFVCLKRGRADYLTLFMLSQLTTEFADVYRWLLYVAAGGKYQQSYDVSAQIARLIQLMPRSLLLGFSDVMSSLCIDASAARDALLALVHRTRMANDASIRQQMPQFIRSLTQRGGLGLSAATWASTVAAVLDDPTEGGATAEILF